MCGESEGEEGKESSSLPVSVSDGFLMESFEKCVFI